MRKSNGQCVLNSKHQCMVGQSKNTNQKETDIRRWFKLHQRVVGCILKNKPFAEQKYYYFDIGCGPGSCPKIFPIFGSPFQFLQRAKETKVRTEAYLFERDKYCCEQLRNGFTKALGHYNVIEGDANKNVPEIISGLTNKFRLGLIYMDYNGPPDFNLLKYMTMNNKTKSLDILINVPIGSYRRILGFQSKHPELNHVNKLEPLEDALKIKRNICYKGSKPGQNQWTLFYLTNGPNIDWKKEGWLPYEGTIKSE